MLRFDHHRVIVQQRWGVLLTYHWMRQPFEDTAEPFVLEVVFQVGRAQGLSADRDQVAILRHPLAPAEVQQLVDVLEWRET